MKNWDTCEADVDRLIGVHYTPGRAGNKIKFIVVHHNAGILSVDDCYNTWQTREASAHYQVETSGRIGQLVLDDNTAWHAGDWNTNLVSIGIEHANSAGANQGWPISSATLENGAHLVASLCKLYGLGRPTWKVNVFPHHYFVGTDCPGVLDGAQNAFYMSRAQAWYDQMTGAPSPKPAPSTSFRVKVGVPSLNIRTGAGTGYGANGAITDRGIYTIVATSGNWGRLKSGQGWICLDYTDRV